MSLLDGVSSVLFVHAHPDDETLSTGALIAELAARGCTVRLVTATRGERGEIVAGSAAARSGVADLSALRTAELDGAARVLGIAERFWLGEPPARAAGLAPRRYLDSGMRWVRPGLAGPASDVHPLDLVAAPPEEAVADLGALLVAVHPDLVISYGPEGGYGHPDHVRTHEVCVAACARAGVRFAQVVGEPGPDGEPGPHAEPAPDVEWFTLDDRLDQVVAALRQHTSQLTVHGTHVVHAGGQREAVHTRVGLSAV